MVSPPDPCEELLAYTNDGPGRICALRFHPRTGALRRAGADFKAVNPSFLAIHRDRPLLFAVHQISQSSAGNCGSVSSFLIDRSSGALTHLNTVSSGGAHPCFAAIDGTGGNLLVANYTGGSVSVLPIEPTGRLAPPSASIRHHGRGTDPKRQSGPFVHSIRASPDNRFAIAADLGLDQLRVYRFDPRNGSLAPHQPPLFAVREGAGPRHFVFHPNGRFVYLINELNSTLQALVWDADRGGLEHAQTVSTLPCGMPSQGLAADVVVHPNGRFLYGSNRGHDSISVWAIDVSNGALTPVENVPAEGSFPWNLTFDPSGSYLLAANQKSGNLPVFRVDPIMGRLSGAVAFLNIPSPVCVRFAAAP